MYILIISFYLGSNAGILQMQEFSSLERCNNAAEYVKSVASYNAKAICILK